MWDNHRLLLVTLGLHASLILCACNRSVPVEEIHVSQKSIDALASVAPLPDPTPGNWPWWRGPALDGKALDAGIPQQWGETENILWKSKVPGREHSTPVVWNSRAYLTTANEQEESQRMLCYSLSNGELLWDTPIHQGGFMHTHKKNSQASSTPACDGERLFVPFMVKQDGVNGIWVSAVDLDGNVVWQTLAGKFTSKHGYGSSPVLYKSLVIVSGDNGPSGFLAALDRATGEIRWRIRRPEMYSFASPVIATLAGRDQLLIHGTQQVASYDPSTGEEIWHCAGPAQTCANTMVFDDQKVYASGGWPEKELLAIRADGSGDVTDSHIAWTSKQAVSYVPSMLVHRGQLFSVSDQGIAMCYNAANGDVVWKKRLGGNFSASPLLVEDNIYVPDEAGKLHVFKASDKFEHVAINDLKDGGFATPVVAGGRIYLRTLHFLYCIGS